jgi:hypothetical protein
MLLRRDLGISHLQREDAFSFYPYCFYDRDNGHVDLYLVVMSLISYISHCNSNCSDIYIKSIAYNSIKRELSLNHIRH